MPTSLANFQSPIPPPSLPLQDIKTLAVDPHVSLAVDPHVSMPVNFREGATADLTTRLEKLALGPDVLTELLKVVLAEELARLRTANQGPVLFPDPFAPTGEAPADKDGKIAAENRKFCDVAINMASKVGMGETFVAAAEKAHLIKEGVAVFQQKRKNNIKALSEAQQQLQSMGYPPELINRLNLGERTVECELALRQRTHQFLASLHDRISGISDVKVGDRLERISLHVMDIPTMIPFAGRELRFTFVTTRYPGESLFMGVRPDTCASPAVRQLAQQLEMFGFSVIFSRSNCNRFVRMTAELH